MEKQNGIHCPTKLVGPRQLIQTPDLEICNPANSSDKTNSNNSDLSHNNGLDRHAQIQQFVEGAVREDARQLISNILEQVANLTWTEKLLLYLKLPTESASTVDPLRQPLNPLGSRSEINQTIMWIRTHLEEDPELSLPKQDVYEEYLSFCSCNKMKPLSTADFGKVMKQVYPRVRPRRLGTRGNSRYCYAGLRKRVKLEPPNLPDLTENTFSSADLVAAAWCVVKEWAENILGMQFASLQALAAHLIDKVSVNTNTAAACLVASSVEKNNNTNSKHKETQLQLQRKLQQKEAKRKLQLGGGAVKKAKNNNVCDKSTDLTALPETKSVEDNEQNDYVACDTSMNLTNNLRLAATGKMPIPRLEMNTVLKTPPSSKRQKNIKYKSIQPKPEKCDKVGKLPDRSHQAKRTQDSFVSIGNVEKDTLDDYFIGGNNSQEQEEELLQYFSSDNANQSKLSQLRLLLQQNYKTKLPPPNLHARRRVSFETQDSVPPSPNTRTKNFSFTPISPGPLSPNASPFVSPRNTPVPRAKLANLVTARNASTGKTATESAPPSPMVPIRKQTNSNWLPKLLDSSKNVHAYFAANYQAEVFAEPNNAYRSQSVPLNNQQLNISAASGSEFADFETFNGGLNTENYNKIFKILDNIQTTQLNEAEIMQTEACFDIQQNIFPYDNFSGGSQNSADTFPQIPETLLPNMRNLGRSQSTDTADGVNNLKYVQPSRSVPSTPLPSLNLNYVNNNNEISSRSYPSTPTDTMIRYNQSAPPPQDYLLNGQPLKEKFGFFDEQQVDDMIFTTAQQDNNKLPSSYINTQNCNYDTVLEQSYSDYVPGGNSNV